MSTDRQLKTVISEFTREIESIIREAVMEEVSVAIERALLDSGGDGRVAGRVPVGATDALGRARKRSARQIEAQTKAVYDHIKAHPGERTEQIVGALGIRTGLVQPLLKRLVTEKRIRAKGKARGTTYTIS